MSQAKVDRYKEEKKNRKQTIKKEKRNRVLGRTLGVVIAAAIVCWIGFSGYSYYQEKKPMTKTELSMTALNEYMSNLSSTAVPDIPSPHPSSCPDAWNTPG